MSTYAGCTFSAAIAMCCLFTATSGGAQDLVPGQAGQAFDVASIKPSQETRVPLARVLPNGQVHFVGVTLRDLIRMAYPSAAGQIDVEGGPGWIGSDRFDVVANAPMNTQPSASMLQRLLAERFNLRVHSRTDQGAVYALRLARADGRLGPALSRSTCGAPDRSPCAPIRIAAGPSLVGQGVTMSNLAATLSNFPVLGGPVIDRTGLTGAYDVQVQFRGATNPNPDAGPLLPDALQEQLGLKVERSTGPRDVVVVDAVARPEPN